ncbi:MAG: hypothetical protein WCX31_10130 [Salinivirgaceae bacterium]
MKHFVNLKLSVKLYFLTFCFIIGLIVFGIMFTNAIKTIGINGSIYSNIIQSKDIIADILPPPEYIIESYLLVFQSLEETNNA